MRESMSLRATFYDLFCYWISGFAFLAVCDAYLHAFCPDVVMALHDWLECSRWAWIFIIIFGYVAGHFANAFSSLLVEHTIAKTSISKKKQPFSKINASIDSAKISPLAKERATVMLNAFKTAFGFSPCEDSRRELRLLAQMYLGGEPPSGFNYMAYYGLNRVLFVVSIMVIVPMCKILSRAGVTLSCIIWAIIVDIFVALVFLWQYLRFVEKYSDFLASIIFVRKLGSARP